MEDAPPAQADPPSRLAGDDGEDRILAALDFLRGIRPAGGEPHWETDTAGQKVRLQEWAKSLGCLLNPEVILPQLRRGGQEHDYFLDSVTGRCFKLTRCGVFGLSPGIDLALVPADQDARRFHLWEATPGQYLERLRLQNRNFSTTIQNDKIETYYCYSKDQIFFISVNAFFERVNFF